MDKQTNKTKRGLWSTARSSLASYPGGQSPHTQPTHVSTPTQILPGGRRRCPGPPDRSESSELRTDSGLLVYGAYSRGMFGTAGTAEVRLINVGVRGSVYAERSKSNDRFDSRTCGWLNLPDLGGRSA